jgi:hypothetical protein
VIDEGRQGPESQHRSSRMQGVCMAMRGCGSGCEVRCPLARPSASMFSPVPSETRSPWRAVANIGVTLLLSGVSCSKAS